MPTSSTVPSRRTLALLVVASVLLAIGCFAVVWSQADDASAWDVPRYQAFGARMAEGEVPYRDFRLEYPPGALPAFVLPIHGFGSTDGPVWEPELNAPARRYARSFALLMLALLVSTVIATATSLRLLRAPLSQCGAALGLLALSPLLLGELVLTRFDMWPAALTSVALALLLRMRFLLSALALGAAIAAKLYPALLVPSAVIQAWRSRGPRAGVMTLVVTSAAALAIFLPFFALAPSEALWPIRVQLERGLHAESLGGSALVAAHVLTLQLDLHGFPMPTVPVRLDESSNGLSTAELVGASADVIGALSTIATVALLVWLWARFGRGPSSPDRLVLVVAATLSVELAVGRVLSPQFLIWLLPVVPLVVGRRGQVASALLAAALLLTHAWFPGPYRDYVNLLSAGPTALLLVRNAVLLALLAALVVPGTAIPRRWGTPEPQR